MKYWIKIFKKYSYLTSTICFRLVNAIQHLELFLIYAIKKMDALKQVLAKEINLINKLNCYIVERCNTCSIDYFFSLTLNFEKNLQASYFNIQ